MAAGHKALFVMFLVFGLIGMIRELDPGIPGEQYFMLVNVINEMDEELDDLAVNVFIFDLGLRLHSNEFQLDRNEKIGKLAVGEIPFNARPGSYWARISVSNDDVRDTKYRLVTIQ
jgi:hypothetical protein